MFAPKFRRMGRIIRSTISQDRLEFAIIGEYDIVGGEYFWSLCKFQGEYWANLERITRRIISSESRGELYWANYIGRIIGRIILGELHRANYCLLQISTNSHDFQCWVLNSSLVFWEEHFSPFIKKTILLYCFIGKFWKSLSILEQILNP